MDGLRGIRHDILDAVPHLVQIAGHLGQRHIEEQGKQEQKAYDHKEDLVVADQAPVQIDRSLLLHIKIRQHLHEDPAKAFVVDSVDHIV